LCLCGESSSENARMTPRTLVILVVLGVVALAGGWYFGIDTLPTQQSSANAGKLMFPDLAPRLQQAARIEVIHQGKPMAIEKREVAGHVRWGLADRGGYPVQETKLRSMLTALTELRLVEQRTADPTQFATLGVEDPTGNGSNSNLVRVLDVAGKPILALIVGHRRVRTGGNVPEEVYVRRPDENQARTGLAGGPSEARRLQAGGRVPRAGIAHLRGRASGRGVARRSGRQSGVQHD
jgi:hypothetical protein